MSRAAAAAILVAAAYGAHHHAAWPHDFLHIEAVPLSADPSGVEQVGHMRGDGRVQCNGR